MTALVYVLGAPFLKVLRRRLGRGAYWSLTTLLSAGLYFTQNKLMAVGFFSLVALIGVFDEFEEMGLSFKVSSFFTLLINTLLAAGAFALWVFYSGPKWSQLVLSFLEASLKPVAEFYPRQINYFDLMLQLPSIAVILWIIAIYVSILLERRLSLGEGPAEISAPMRPQLASLRLPDAVIWIFIASVLGAFGDFQVHVLEAISVNAMNICMVLLFFQGLAVVSKFCERVKMAIFWQVLFMIVIITQLFPLVSLLGLLDYWLNFRNRLSKSAEQFKRET